MNDVLFTRLRRMAGYLKTLAAGATLLRVMNLFRNEVEYQTGAIRLRSLPPTVTIDITNRCHLRCPLCASGLRQVERAEKVMPLSDFESVLDQIAPRAFQIFLYCWGEPLLVNNIADYIAAAKARNLGVTLSTNFSMVQSDAQLESLVLARPDRLIVSLDGIDEETYLLYRKGGDFARVKDNVARIAQVKARLGANKPEIVWQFLAFSHNEFQILIAAELYRSWGFDSFEVEKPNLPFGVNDETMARQWFARNPELRLAGPFDVKDNVGNFCFWPWRSAIVNPDGSLSPCCYISDPKYDAGNVIAQGFAAAWNSRRMQCLRKTIRKDGSEPPCAGCSAVIG